MENLKKLFRAWKRTGKRLAAFQTRFLFRTAYIFIFVPFGIIFRLLSREDGGGWQPASLPEDSREEAGKMF